MLKRLSDIIYLAAGQRSPLPTSEPDPSEFEGREEWLIIAQHRQKLIRLGVNLVAIELVDAVSGYPENVEGAIIAFLERLHKPNLSATRKLAVLIRRGATPTKPACANTPRLPVRTAADFAPPLVPPAAAPRRSLPELQADLDKGGASAIAVRAMLRYNPQWGLAIIDGRIKPRLLPENICELEKVRL